MLDKDDKPVKETVQLERPKVFIASVFNAEQIDGLPPMAVRQDKSWNSIERAESILEASGAKISHDQVDRAFTACLQTVFTYRSRPLFQVPTVTMPLHFMSWATGPVTPHALIVIWPILW
nr:IncP-type DNA transfer primase TraC [Salmonella enterica subsp. enterica serovar Rissen]